MTSNSKRSKKSSNLRETELPSLEEIRAEKRKRAALKHLKEFVQQGWHVLEPATPYIHNWHIDVICDHLEAVSRNAYTPEGIKRLLINIPPGHMKSLIVNVFWPAWTWLQNPNWKAIFTTYDSGLGSRDSVKCRDLITSQWYQETFKPAWKLKPDQNEKTYYFNTLGGFRITLTVAGGNTGYRGDAVVVDDPISAMNAKSPTARAAVIEWYRKAMSSRLNNLAHGAFVVIMQRLHEQDLAGDIIDTNGTDPNVAGGYNHICLPSEYDGLERHPTSLGWSDPRTELGELLFPELFPRPVIEQAKKDLLNDYSGQHQQTPVPADGNIFKPRWLRYWIPRDRADLLGKPVTVQVDNEFFECPVVMLPHTLEELREQPNLFDFVAQSWDMTFGSKKKTASKVVGQVWATKGADHYLLDEDRDKYDLPETLNAVERMTRRWPHVIGKLIEDKAFGAAVRQTLVNSISGMLAVLPYGDKEFRASAIAPLHAAGNVYLPHPALFPWVSGLQIRLAAFPAADTDEIDTMSQYLQWASAQIQSRVGGASGGAVVGPGDVLNDDGEFYDDYE